MTGSLALHLPGIELRLDGLPDRTLRALDAVWGACTEPRGPAVLREHWQVERAGDGYAVLRSGSSPETAHTEDRVAPLIEGLLYGSLPRWYESETLLHAATVVRGTRPVLLLGDSGAGKSSLALEAVRAGLHYVTDELTLTDGSAVRGITRTIQFDPVPVGSVLPARLGDLDVASYRVTFDDGVERAQPLFPWPELDVATAPLDAALAIVVVLSGAAETTSFAPISPVEALAALHEQTRGSRTGPFGRLLGSGRVFRLAWREPREGLSEIVRAVDALGQ